MNKTEILQALSQLPALDRREVLVHLLNLTADDVRAEIRPRLHRLVRDDVSLLDQFRTPYFGPPPDLESRLSFSAELVLKPLVALPIPNSLWEPMWMAGAFKLGDLLDTVPANWCREHQCAPELFERLRPLLDHLAVQTGSGSPRLSDGKPTFKGLNRGNLRMPSVSSASGDDEWKFQLRFTRWRSRFRNCLFAFSALSSSEVSGLGATCMVVASALFLP